MYKDRSMNFMKLGAQEEKSTLEEFKLHRMIWIVPLYEEPAAEAKGKNAKILLLERKAEDDLYPRALNLVTGHIHEGEEVAHAIRRELQEEVGVPISDAVYGGTYLTVDNTNVFIVNCFVAWLENTEVKLTEHKNYHFVDFEYFAHNIKDYNLTPPEKITLMIHIDEIRRAMRKHSSSE
ncbi:MAG: NUDIX hydrolase [Candidatus Micrarchaeia archaeon]